MLPVSVKVAVREPNASGTKFTLIVQFFPGPTLTPEPVHESVSEKSPASAPETAILLTTSGPLPVFETVTDFVPLEVPTTVGGKDRPGGESTTIGIVPVPESPTVCGELGPVSEKDSDAERAPVAVGVNITVMVQAFPEARPTPPIGQLFVWLKSLGSGPVKPMLLMVSGPLPVFVSVVLCPALGVPTFCDPRFRLVGTNMTPGAVPVPLRAMICVLGVASSLMSTCPVVRPCAAGVKDTVIVQFELGGTVPVDAQVLLPVKEKSLGVPTLGSIFTDVIVRAWFPVFERVMTGPVEVVLTFTLPNEREVCDNITTGCVPVPVSVMDCGLPPALSAMLTEAKRDKLAVGAKSTTMLHEVEGARPGEPTAQVVCGERIWKSPGLVPVVPRVAMMRFALPVLVKVTVCDGDVLPTLMLPNVSVFVDKLATAPAPVPLRGTV